MKEVYQRVNRDLGSEHKNQMVRRYPIRRDERHFHTSHILTDLPDFHSGWDNIVLEWTGTGSWLQVPMLEDYKGSAPRSYRVARKATYINEKGN